VSVTSFLTTRFFPFRTISSNSPCLASRLATISSIFTPYSAISSFTISRDSIASSSSQYHNSNWTVAFEKTVSAECTSSNSSPRFTVLSSNLSNLLVTSRSFVSIFLARRALLAVATSSCAECATLSTLGRWLSTSDCNRRCSRSCSSRRSFWRLAGRISDFSWFSVTFSHCIKLSRASCTPWLRTSAVSRARHLSASASESWLYFSSSSTTGVSKAAFSVGVCWPSRDLKRAAILCFAASISLPWATNSLFNVLALFSCSSTVFGSAPIGSERTLVALGSASRNHVRALSKASRYSRWRPPTPDNRSDNPLARESKSRYCVVTADTSLRTTESCEGSMWGNRCGRLVRNSFKCVRYSLDSSTNFCAAIVMNRKSAWWAITSLTNSLVLSVLMFSLFKLDKDLSLSSKVCRALWSQVQNAASSFLNLLSSSQAAVRRLSNLSVLSTARS